MRSSPTWPCPGRTRGGEPGDKLLVQDVIADAMLQQVLTRPASYDVIATTNLNGDYLSDALAAQVGGIGIAPGGNINYDTGVAVFEATHGTAPKYAGQDKVNPGSVILSGEMMFRYLGWNEAADRLITRVGGRHRGQESDLRLRAADGGRHQGDDFGVRRRHHRPHVAPSAGLGVEPVVTLVGDVVLVTRSGVAEPALRTADGDLLHREHVVVVRRRWPRR